MSGHGAEVEMPHGENDPFTKTVALSVAIFAVILAVAGAGGKNAGKDMMSAQMDSMNEFSQYQAKAQREVMYVQERESLEPVVSVHDGQQDELSKGYENALKNPDKLKQVPQAERQRMRLAYINTKLAEYVKEKKDLKDNGDAFIAERKLNHRKDGYFDYAELLLQLGIVLASISMLSKARWPYLISLVLAVGGLALTVGGFVIPKYAPTVHIPMIDPDHSTEKHDEKH